MNVMIVGADHIGNIGKNLRAVYSITNIDHVCGRNVAHRKIKIPQAISLIVVLIDYINHGTARRVKEEAKAKGVPAIFAKRSWCSLQEQLANFEIGEKWRSKT